MWRSPGKLKRVSLLIKQRLFGKITIEQELELRHRLMLSSVNGQRVDRTKIGFYWRSWAYVRFWQAPLDIEIQTSNGKFDRSEVNAIWAAVNRDVPSIKSTASDQVTQWLGKQRFKKTNSGNEESSTLLDPPTLKFDFRESCFPGHFTLVFENGPGRFYHVQVRAWSIVSDLNEEE